MNELFCFLTDFDKVVWAILWLQPLALGFIKLSLLFFYRRIFIGRSFNIVSWTLIGLVSAWMAVFAFGLFFDCGTNIAANWGSLEEISEKCEFGFLPTIIYTIIDSGLDLIILFTPLPWVCASIMSARLPHSYHKADIRAPNVCAEEALHHRVSYARRPVCLPFPLLLPSSDFQTVPQLPHSFGWPYS